MEEHNHSHSSNRNSLVPALIITGSLAAMEFIGGFYSNSLSLLSDAGHMLTDLLSLFLSFFAIQFSQKLSDTKKTYGYYRLEILASAVNGALLLFISLYIAYEAFIRFQKPVEIKTAQMLVIAFIGLTGNLATMFFLKDSSKHNLNIKSAFLHVLSDTLSSAGVILGGLIILYTGWTKIDSIIGFLISILILRSTLMLMIETVNILLEAVPAGIDITQVQKEIESIPGIKSLHDLHIWSITSGFHALSGHLLIDDQMLSQAGEIVKKAKNTLKEKFDIGHTTIEIECEHCGQDFICNEAPSPHSNDIF